MDPDVCLQDLLQSADMIIEMADRDEPDNEEEEQVSKEEIIEEAIDLAERAQALDGWVRKGGFLPERWRQPQKPSIEVRSIQVLTEGSTDRVYLVLNAAPTFMDSHEAVAVVETAPGRGVEWANQHFKGISIEVISMKGVT